MRLALICTVADGSTNISTHHVNDKVEILIKFNKVNNTIRSAFSRKFPEKVVRTE